jgi:putative addiction module component (TIGR02574 family)
MSDRAKQLKSALVELAEEDRAELAQYLLESLDPPGEELTEDEWHAAWTAELERRMADIKSGKEKGIPMEDVMKELREKYP